MEEQIDILLATYNGEKYLREQIDSILNQTYKNIKLIISDDCSIDGTANILKEYAENLQCQDWLCSFSDAMNYLYYKRLW